jgi:tetratricopeptide (TPR) repeat protein
VAANSVSEFDRSLSLRPFDPAAHFAYAQLLKKNGETDDAVKQFFEAASLRPNDYSFWLELARTSDQAGDNQLALSAFKRAVELAPYYVQPRWELGKHFLHVGNTAAAFTEFRRAATSNGAVFPELIDRAWEIYGPDANTVEQIVQPGTSRERTLLTRFFVRKGKVAEAMTLFRSTAVSPAEQRQIVEELMDSKYFVEAYEVWSRGRGGTLSSGEITDGGFETSSGSIEPGFGWQLTPDLQDVETSFDKRSARSGARSLLIQFNSLTKSGPAVAYQIVLVEPNTRYRLQFAVRIRALVAAPEPLTLITIADAKRGDRDLAQFVTTPESDAWQEQSLEFTTEGTTTGVILAVARRNCSSEPCMLDGQIWLDDLQLLRN